MKFKNCTIFSNNLFRLPISSDCKLTLISLHKYQNSEKGIFPSHISIGLDCSFSRFTAQKCLNILEAQGYVTIQKKKDGNGKFANSVYTINYEKIDGDKNQSHVETGHVAGSHMADINTNNKMPLNNKNTLNNMYVNTIDPTNEDKAEKNTHKEFKILIKDNLTQTNSQSLITKQVEEVFKGKSNTLSELCADPIASYNPTQAMHMGKNIIIQNLTVIQNSNTNSIPLDYSSNNRPTREDNNFKPQYNNNIKQIQSAANKEKFGATLVDVLRPVFDDPKKFVDFRAMDELKDRVDLDELRELRDWMSTKFYKIKITFVSSSSELLKEIERVKKLRQKEIDEREKRRIEIQKPKETEEQTNEKLDILRNIMSSLK